MATGLFNWSRTAASNASATYTWAEGMAPSAVNDSARGIMSDVAQYRDDIAGAIVTGGTTTAYTVTSYSTFTSLALMAGQLIAFTPHATNAGTTTLNVDGLGAKPLRSSTGVEILSGTLIAGTPYLALYNNSDAVFYLHGFYGNPYNIPLGAGLDYWGSTAPNSSFVLAQGQAISRTTYSTLFTLFGTTYGVGNGTTTFNIPDKVGRTSAMLDAGSARLSASYFGASPANLGAVGGSESHTLTTAQLASHSHAFTADSHDHSFTYNTLATDSGAGGTTTYRLAGIGGTSQSVSATTVTGSNASTGSGSAHNNVQPTIICNYIIRII